MLSTRNSFGCGALNPFSKPFYVKNAHLNNCEYAVKLHLYLYLELTTLPRPNSPANLTDPLNLTDGASVHLGL